MFGNSVKFLGRLTNDIELTTTTNSVVTNFTLARNRQKTDKDAEQEADFIRFVAWGKTAEFLSKYFSKGDRVGVEGRLQARNYTDKDGNNRTITEVVVENVEFIEKKSSSDNVKEVTPVDNSNPVVDNNSSSGDEDFPF